MLYKMNIHIEASFGVYTVVATLTGGGGTNVGRAPDLSEGV